MKRLRETGMARVWAGARAPGLWLAAEGRSAGPGDVRWLRAHLIRAMRRLGMRGWDVTVVIVKDRAMRDLHRRFSDVDGTTDVLTFDLSDEQSTAAREAEIYICADEARRRVRESGRAVRPELLLYAVHGLLHLLGHEDHSAAGFRRMHALEDRVLTDIGVGPVFWAVPTARRGGHRA